MPRITQPPASRTLSLMVQESVHDDFVRELVEAVQKLRVGAGMDAATTHGPLIQHSAVETVGWCSGALSCSEAGMCSVCAALQAQLQAFCRHVRHRLPPTGLSSLSCTLSPAGGGQGAGRHLQGGNCGCRGEAPRV